jgi:DNA phosphorothioation-associated putative methyltransferase
MSIQRHRTALVRSELSLPMRFLHRFGFLGGQYSVFDYGCGRGNDLDLLKQMRVPARGWDPIFKPKAKRVPSDVVNLGYVLNVIEDPQERRETLLKAFELTQRVLVVSVMLGYQGKRQQFERFEDGVVTKRQTFQKYFTQDELKEYLEGATGRSAIPIAPGICLLFRADTDEQLFLLSRQQVRREWKLLRREPDDLRVADLIAAHRSTVDAYWATALDLGRPPAPEECNEANVLSALVGSWKKIHDWVGQFFDSEYFEAANLARHEDLLVYFALSHFSRRKPYTEYPRRLQRDVQFFFGSITKARDAGRRVLFALANGDQIQAAAMFCHKELGIGHLNEGHDLIIHQSVLADCVPLIRVYVGCAAQLFGDLEGVDLVKIHFHSGKVTFLTYDDFDGSDTPLLMERVKVDLPRLRVDFFEYGEEYAPQKLEVPKAILISADSKSDE